MMEDCEMQSLDLLAKLVSWIFYTNVSRQIVTVQIPKLLFSVGPYVLIHLLNFT